MYRAIDTRNGDVVVMKFIKPLMQTEKVHREVMILENLRGGPNIVNFRGISKDPSTGLVIMIFDYLDSNGETQRDEFRTFSDFENRYYML